MFQSWDDFTESIRKFRLADRLGGAAPAVVIVIIDILALIAEYRVWDVGMQMTGSPFKALGFVAISAVPFYVGQVAWLYPRANLPQQGIAILCVVSAVVTAYAFGRVDLLTGINFNTGEDVIALANTIPLLTGGYILLFMFYILVDPVISQNRRKARLLAQADLKKTSLAITRTVLEEEAKNKQVRDQLAGTHGRERVDKTVRKLGVEDEEPNPTSASTPQD